MSPGINLNMVVLGVSNCRANWILSKCRAGAWPVPTPTNLWLKREILFAPRHWVFHLKQREKTRPFPRFHPFGNHERPTVSPQARNFPPKQMLTSSSLPVARSRRFCGPLSTLCALLFAAVSFGAAEERPNILWLTSEDHGPQLGSYGDRIARTPNLDALAARGMLFKRVWATAPVCAAARTTIISGMLAPSLGAEHMRSEVAMPAGMKMFPQLLREAGYYCTNQAKEDYNLTKPGQVWDVSSKQAHWKNRPAGHPFFAVFNATESHESQINKRPHRAIVDPAAIRVPAYHPDTPEVRRDWAQYYDQVSVVDRIAGERLKELAEAGLEENTIVFYYADHGAGMPRSKRWPSNSGLQVPMIVYFPPKWRHLAPDEYAPGARSDRLVSFVDLAPTVLSLAGIPPPSKLPGRPFAGRYQTSGPAFLHGFRGRMDERYDFVRSVTDGRFVYLRNYHPHRSQAQHVNTQFENATTQVWGRRFETGELNDAQTIFWRTPKASEEFYDLQNDPDEVRNLSGSAEHRAVLEKLRAELRANASRTRDLGFLSEAEMHTRAGKKSPRDALATDATYPFAQIFIAAETATFLAAPALPQLKTFLRDADSAVRYWGAMGALMRGAAAVKALRPELLATLDDPSPSVRIAAAEALARYSNPTDLELALATLKICADPTQTSAYASIAAMNTIDELGGKAASLLDFIRTMPTSDPNATQRANVYVSRLQAYILSKVASKNSPSR